MVIIRRGYNRQAAACTATELRSFWLLCGAAITAPFLYQFVLPTAITDIRIIPCKARNQFKQTRFARIKRKTEIPQLGISAFFYTSLFSQRILKIFAPCAVILGMSKCFHKGGFPVRTGRVAYFAYASGLGVQGNALREVLSRAVSAP